MSLDLALDDVRLPGPVGDGVAAPSAPPVTAVCGSGSCSTRTSARRSRGPSSRRPRAPSRPARAAGVPLKAIRLARPDASTGTRARRRGGLDGLGQLDARQLDARRETCSRRESRELAEAYTRDFEQLWQRGRVDERDGFDALVLPVGEATIRRWFCPGRGPELSHRIAKRIGAARRADAHRLAGADGRADPRDAERGAAEGRSTSPASATRRRSPRSSTSGSATRARAGRAAAARASRCSTASTESHTPGHRSTPSMHAKVTGADDTIVPSARSTSRARARRTPRRARDRRPGAGGADG